MEIIKFSYCLYIVWITLRLINGTYGIHDFLYEYDSAYSYMDSSEEVSAPEELLDLPPGNYTDDISPESGDGRPDTDVPIPPSLSYTKTHNVIAGSNVMLPCGFETLGGLMDGSWSRGDEILTDNLLVLSEDARLNVILGRKFTTNIYRCRFNRYNYGRDDIIAYILQELGNSEKSKTVSKKLDWEFHSHTDAIKIEAAINESVIFPCQALYLVSERDELLWFINKYAQVETIMTARHYEAPRRGSTRTILSGYTLEIQNVTPNDSNIDYVCKLQHPITKESLGTITHKLIVSDPKLNETTDVCSPSPCGIDSECRPNGEYPECACRHNFKGNPPACPADCDGNCPARMVCLNDDCKDLQEKACGENAIIVISVYKYTCNCPENYYGDPYVKCSRNDTIHVPKIKSENQTFEVIQNGTITLPCEAAWKSRRIRHVFLDDFNYEGFLYPKELDDSMPKLWWMKRPENASYQHFINFPEPRIRLYSIHNLRIENVKHSDAGFYVCQLKNFKKHNITYKLEISGAPNSKKIIKTSDPPIPFTAVKVRENDTVILPCEGVNELRAEYLNWIEIYFKTGDTNSEFIEIPLKLNDKRITILRGTNLEIQNVQPEDAGAYSCYLPEKSHREEGRFLLATHILKVLGSGHSENQHTDPCQGNPCGLDSECYPQNGEPICSCRNYYKGHPPHCTPIDPHSRCSRGEHCFELACINNHCKDLCEQTCQLQNNAKCRIKGYKWTCMCDYGFLGNPYNGGCLPGKPVNKDLGLLNGTIESKIVATVNQTIETQNLEPFNQTAQFKDFSSLNQKIQSKNLSENFGHHSNKNDQDTESCGAGCLFFSIGGSFVLLLLLLAFVYMIKRKRRNYQLIHYRHRANDNTNLELVN